MPSIPHPVLSLQLWISPWCPQPRGRKKPCEGRPGGSLSMPCSQPASGSSPGCGACGRSVSPGSAGREARLDPCKDPWLHRKGGQHPQALPRAEPFSRDPLVGCWGVGENVTCGLAMDTLWDLAVLRILCLEIALSGSGSRAGVPDCSLAGTRAQGPRVGRRPRGQLPWRDTRASSLTQLLPYAVPCFPASLCRQSCCPSYGSLLLPDK